MIVPRYNPPAARICNRCGRELGAEHFSKTRSPFFPDGLLPTCNECLTGYLKNRDYSWDSIDKLCQWADIPFIVKEWERLLEMNSPDTIWEVYARVFQAECYEELGWDSYHKQYKRLKEVGLIEDEIPLLHEKKLNDLRRKWGPNYDDDDLYQLEDLYKGLLATQNVNGALQIDQAQKLCKLSLEIDSRIRAGDKDVDKFLSSYDKLVKTGEFTPKNAKNASNFDSFAELAYWLEKRGKQNRFYDGTTRDVIDEAIKNIENYNQRLYINEGGIGDEITKRLQILQNVNNDETDSYGLEHHEDLDDYDAAAYVVDGEQEEFEV